MMWVESNSGDDTNWAARAVPADTPYYYWSDRRGSDWYAFVVVVGSKVHFCVEGEQDTPYADMLPAASVEEAKMRAEVALRLLGAM